MRKQTEIEVGRTQNHFCDVHARDAQPESNHEEISGKPTLRELLQNNWPVIFKVIKAMKVKEKLRNCSRLKETRDMATKYNV